MTAFLFNVVIAVLWLLLNRTPSAMGFGIGFAIGFVLVAAFRSVIGGEAYVRRSFAFVRFVLLFFREFVLANIKVAGVVLFRSRKSLHPNFITYDVAGMTRAEILLISYCITLTPGTTTIEITPDFNTLIVHALEAEQPDQIRKDVDQTLKKSIFAFTR